MNRFLCASVVRGLPFGDLGVEGHLQRKFAQARLNVSGCRGVVSRQDVSPVSLGFHHDVLLTQLHQGVANGSIPVGVVLHGLTDDVGYFVEPTVLHFAQGVEESALNRLEAVFQSRNGALQNNVGSVVQEVISVHAAHAGRGVFQGKQFRRLGVHFQLRSLVLCSSIRKCRRLQRFGCVLGKGDVLGIVHGHSAASSNSTRKFSMMNSWRSGVFLPM